MPALTAKGAITCNFRVTNPSNGQYIGGTARVDTGADITVIDTSISGAIAAVPVGYLELEGVDGQPQNSPVYVVDLDLGDLGYASDVQVVGDSQLYNNTGYSCLVGVDILSSGILVYDGPTLSYQLSIGVTKGPAISQSLPRWIPYTGGTLIVLAGLTAAGLALRRR
jgi:hypothetical protein